MPVFLVRRFYLSGEDPRFYKRGINQYLARLSGGLQSPTEINAPRGCAGIRFGRYQLTLTRIPRQFSQARIESSSRDCTHDEGEFHFRAFLMSEDTWKIAMKNRIFSKSIIVSQANEFHNIRKIIFIYSFLTDFKAQIPQDSKRS